MRSNVHRIAVRRCKLSSAICAPNHVVRESLPVCTTLSTEEAIHVGFACSINQRARSNDVPQSQLEMTVKNRRCFTHCTAQSRRSCTHAFRLPIHNHACLLQERPQPFLCAASSTAHAKLDEKMAGAIKVLAGRGKGCSGQKTLPRRAACLELTAQHRPTLLHLFSRTFEVDAACHTRRLRAARQPSQHHAQLFACTTPAQQVDSSQASALRHAAGSLWLPPAN
ncbi:hypothetical protein IWZ00DRAFT_105484 [Phyllosticta capitalensis]